MFSLAVRLKNAAKSFVAGKDEGTSAVEYGILAGLIAIVIIGAVTALGTQLTAVFNNVVAALKAA